MHRNLICLIIAAFIISTFGEFQASAQSNVPFDVSSTPDYHLQKGLEKIVARLQLGKAAKEQRLGIAVLDITNPDRIKLAAINPNLMMYSASLPKIAILFGLFKRMEEGTLRWNLETSYLANAMIQESSNTAATQLYHQVTPQYIEQLLVSPRYNLYNRSQGGGLWVGKEYGKGEAWKREPLKDLSHAASPIKVAQFFYLLDSNRLVNPALTHIMKGIMSKTSLHTKLVKGIKDEYPDAVLYRKSGTWGNFQSDGALVEHAGKRFIIAAMTNDKDGSIWLEKLALAIDKLVLEPVRCVRLQPCFLD